MNFPNINGKIYTLRLLLFIFLQRILFSANIHFIDLTLTHTVFILPDTILSSLRILTNSILLTPFEVEP